MNRLLDLALVIGSAPLTLPVAALVGLGVRRELGSPILFRQRRPGLHGEIFEILKFRSMREAVDGSGRALPDAERLTPFGLRLRATSLDELPSLFNVLRGDMSLVGPRPLLSEYLPLYSRAQARRHEVRPGLTGWAQVNGRNALGWEERFALDVWYVDHRNVRLDLRILWLTVSRVWRRDGIAADGEATMSRFTGRSDAEADP